MTGDGRVRLIGNANDPSEALEALDDLRAKIKSGEVIAFAAVGIEPDDTTRQWVGSARSVSRLRLIGAIQTLLAANS